MAAGSETPQQDGLPEEGAFDDAASCCEWRAGGEIPQRPHGGLDEEPVADGATCCEWRAGGEIPQQACDGEGDGVRVEEQGGLTAAQMCGLVDAVVNNLRESSKWQTMPPVCASDVLAELKAPYEDGAGTVYTQRQALEIMEHTGRKCGDAFNLFQMGLRDAPKDSEKRFKQFLKMQSNGLMKPASIEDE